MLLSIAAVLALAYFLGSIPFGIIAGKAAKGVDIREHGSKNTGATNVFRVVGKPWGILVLFLDAFKGYLAVAAARFLLAGEAPYAWIIFAGVTAILGHSFSVWLSFKGGKGVATSLGVFLALAPLPTAVTFLAWCLVFTFTRIISISSLCAAVLFPLTVALWMRNAEGFPVLLGVSCLLMVFIFYTHRANISRLKKGEEKRLI